MKEKKYKKNIIALSCILLFFSGCSVYHVHKFDRPPVKVPDNFLQGEGGSGNISQWWKEFKQPALNELVEIAFRQNFDLRQAWDRLAQAKAAACIVNSEMYPEINLTTTAEFTHQINHRNDTNTSYMGYLVAPTLSYEVDLWRRIDSRIMAADLNYCATKEEVEATALFLSGAVTNSWFTIQEQKALLDLINYQVEVSETLLELVELRFSLGQSSALDVYQQRLQLEETRITAIPVKAALQNASHQLSILLGYPPTEFWSADLQFTQIELPPFPYMGTPAELIQRRPDLRAAHYRVESADFEVAAAIADIYPKLTLPTLYELRTRDIGQLFQEELFRIATRFVTPIIDGCRRRCEVNRRKAILAERLDNFAQRFLVSLQEVEDAVVNEEAELEVLEQLGKQVKIARLNLDEARLRYATGLNDYLTVISAIQAVQRLERRMILDKRILLVNRSTLYRALGSPALFGCPERTESEPGIFTWNEGEIGEFNEEF